MLSKAGHAVAKALGIKLQDHDRFRELDRPGASMMSDRTDHTFVEEPPLVLDYLGSLAPSGKELYGYLLSLFPFLSWIGHYNLQWLIGDLVAGITIGAVVVPQGMAYAKLANLEVQFGLYSSFMGVLVYWFFATSKDITIGPVAVMSQLTGGIVADLAIALPDVPGHVIASALALLAGSIVLFIGLIRCGWIVDLISLTALSAFMTGSALNIVVGQIPSMMGITGFSTREAPYIVFIHTLQGLPRTTLDAAMGLTALAMLYLIRGTCAYAAKRWPKHQRIIFFLSTLRTVFVILLYTMISWLVNRGLPKDQIKFKILLDVPRGFQNAAVPVLNQRIASNLAGYLPATVIVLLIEHIAISKSFGRVNNYTINPSQEMVAIGVTNMLGPFLGGYAATGSFSRTAIKSKAGVRSPFAGVITALVVLLAIYALPAVFYFIPAASLAAVIIHAVGDLITPPNTVYQFWLVSPLENGIYCTVCLSAAMLLFRILRAKGRFLGRVKVASMLGDHVVGDDSRAEYGTFTGSPEAPFRNVFLPITHADGSNPEVELDNPYPGIFIYRFSEGFNYTNASNSLSYMTEYIFAHTRLTNLTHFDRPGDRPWNDPGPSRRKLKAAAAASASALEVDTTLPTLKAIILDFSSVNHVDITSVQQLIDVRNQLDRYAAPDTVDWHIACISNRWAKRALAAAGFGYPTMRPDVPHLRWKSIFSVAEIGGAQSAAAAAEFEDNEKELLDRRLSVHGSHHHKHHNHQERDLEAGLSKSGSHAAVAADDVVDAAPAADVAATSTSTGTTTTEDLKAGTITAAAPRLNCGRTVVAVHGINRPLFHVDLTSALQSAIANVEARGEGGEEEEDGAEEASAGGASASANAARSASGSGEATDTASGGTLSSRKKSSIQRS
ncbi:sulfate transporter family-domain-containing protein [Chaetomidium leptoderma]|uniref:Sulfate transporter family-domain-containing protein n=1 Tax=Chaetomidium leptoderma TaxID=669021 RepID=A0AAN6VNB9_9PEZI|nr:sulfate transporter family-domain-containing protein [Chaetomidium leptoderma]